MCVPVCRAGVHGPGSGVASPAAARLVDHPSVRAGRRLPDPPRRLHPLEGMSDISVLVLIDLSTTRLSEHLK